MMKVVVLFALVFVGAVFCEDEPDADQADHYSNHYSYSYSSKPVVTPARTYVPAVRHVNSMAGGLRYGSIFRFRSSNYPGSMFRHRNWQVWLDPLSNAALYVKDFSFNIVRGLAGKGIAFFNRGLDFSDILFTSALVAHQTIVPTVMSCRMDETWGTTNF